MPFNVADRLDNKEISEETYNATKELKRAGRDAISSYSPRCLTKSQLCVHPLFCFVWEQVYKRVFLGVSQETRL